MFSLLSLWVVQVLEALPLAAEFHDAPLFWGWPHSGGLSAEQIASDNRAMAAAYEAQGQTTAAIKKKKPLYAWGQRCWQPGLDHVLVAVPYNPGMVEALQQRLADTLNRLECGSRGTVSVGGVHTHTHLRTHYVHTRACMSVLPSKSH
jgi:hypothetical protein